MFTVSKSKGKGALAPRIAPQQSILPCSPESMEIESELSVYCSKYKRLQNYCLCTLASKKKGKLTITPSPSESMECESELCVH